MAPSVLGECYINFSKLLQSELRSVDKRQSTILQKKMSLSMKKQTSLRSSNRGGLLSATAKAQFELSVNLNEQKAQKRAFSEQLWHMGKVVGQVKGEFELSNIPQL